MTPRGNGVVNRIKHVLDTHEVNDQGLVNKLLLEAMVELDTNLRGVASTVDAHHSVHEEINEQLRERVSVVDDVHDAIDERIGKLENVIFFPSRHPRQSLAILFGFLFALNLWFISGFRAMILEALNAPNWLIDLLAPGYLP